MVRGVKMLGIYHPFSRALYEQDGEGNVLVTDEGKTGLFRADGSWISGEIKECDPQLCNWIAGPQLGTSGGVNTDE